MSRVLAVDVGSRRVGVALSDPSRTLATPQEPIEVKDLAQTVSAVVDLALRRDVDTIVVGMPITLRGEQGPQALRVEEFIAALEDALARRAPGVRVVRWDERLSTVEAEALLRQAGYDGRSRKGRVDSAAAAVILQGFLDAEKLAGEGE